MTKASSPATMTFTNHGILGYVDGTGDFRCVRPEPSLLSR